MFGEKERVLLIHIGMGKTGTSTLQLLLHRNREKLLQFGWAYPPRDLLTDVAKKGAYGNITDFAQRWNSAFRAGEETGTKSLIEDLVQRLERIEDPRVLLSSEWLYTTHPTFWAQIAEACKHLNRRPVIFAYVREQREWLLSAYAQRVTVQKIPETGEEFFLKNLEQSGLNYLKRYNSFVEIFGAANVVMRRFQRSSLVGGDICADFLQLLGVDLAALNGVGVDTNISPGVIPLELMRVLNSCNETPWDYRTLLRLAQKLNIPQSKDLYRLVKPETMRAIAKKYGKTNKHLNEILYPGQPGGLFTSKIPDEYEPYRPEDLINRQTIELMAAYHAEIRGETAAPSRVEADPNE